MEIAYHDTDQPGLDGLYVAYTNGMVRSRAERVFLTFDAKEGKWYHPMSDIKYRDKVYACIGPLPILKLTDGDSQ